jgi:hypothetical protein
LDASFGRLANRIESLELNPLYEVSNGAAPTEQLPNFAKWAARSKGNSPETDENDADLGKTLSPPRAPQKTGWNCPS